MNHSLNYPAPGKTRGNQTITKEKSIPVLLVVVLCLFGQNEDHRLCGEEEPIEQHEGGPVEGKSPFLPKLDSSDVSLCPENTTPQIELLFEISDTRTVRRITQHRGKWVAVGEKGLVIRSEDGLNWSMEEVSTSENFTDVACGDGLWVAVGDKGSIFTSTDRIDWSQKYSREHGSGVLNDVQYSAGKWVCGGYRLEPHSSPPGIPESIYRAQFVISENGIDWQPVLLDTFSISNVSYGNSRWLASTSTNRIATSTDGQFWQTIGSDTFPSFEQNSYRVAYGPGYWVLTHNQMNLQNSTLHLYQSKDGLSWSRIENQNPIINGSLHLQFAGGKWLNRTAFRDGRGRSGVIASETGAHWEYLVEFALPHPGISEFTVHHGFIYAATPVSQLQPGFIIRIGPFTELMGHGMRVENLGGVVSVFWDAGILQTASEAMGPWTTLPDATSPYSLKPLATSRFFRLAECPGGRTIANEIGQLITL